jgi:ribose-phosphate pyrophosphokinase
MSKTSAPEFSLDPMGGRLFEATKKAPLALPSKRLIIPNHPDFQESSWARLGIETGLDGETLEQVLLTDQMVILTGRSNPKLARAIGEKLGMKVEEPVDLFEDGEPKIIIKHNLRNREVFIIQPTVRAIDEKGNETDSFDRAFMHLCAVVQAASLSSAKQVTAVIPYYSGRQDRKDRSRAPITAALLGKLLETAGANRIVTIDLHSEQTMGAVSIPWDNLYGRYALLPEIEKEGLENLVVAAPDAGGGKRAEIFSGLLGGEGDIALVYKTRPKPGESKVLRVAGDVRGKRVVIVDDMIGGGGTIVGATKEIIEECGATEVIVAATHGHFSGEAIKLIEDSMIKKIFVTDTIDHKPEARNHPKIKVVSLADLIAQAIMRIHTGESLAYLIPEKANGSTT